MSRQSEPAGETPACPWPAGQVERWPSARCRRAAFTGRVAMHQASGQSFDERAARQAVNQER
jgi:hypothetical protein